MEGLSHWWAPHLLAPQALLSIWETGPEAQNAQIPKAQRERELAPNSKVPCQDPLYQESDFSLCPSEKQKSAAKRSRSWHETLLMHLCLARQAPAAPSALLPSSS